MEYSINKSSIIMTCEVYPYSILSFIEREDSYFESFDFWEGKRKINKIKEKLCGDVVINQHLLSFSKNPNTGDIVEIECDGDTDNVITWLRYKDNWFITDITEEPAV